MALLLHLNRAQDKTMKHLRLHGKKFATDKRPVLGLACEGQDLLMDGRFGRQAALSF